MDSLDNNKIYNDKPKITLIQSIEKRLPLGAILHFLFLILFYLKGILPLIYFNIFSIIIYIIIYIFLIKKHFFISCIIIFFEIVMHSILCVLYIGWTGGFYIYPLCILPIAYFISINLTKKQLYGHIFVIFILGNYQFCNIFSSFRIAKYEKIFEQIGGKLYNFNTTIACIVIMVLLCFVLYEMK